MVIFEGKNVIWEYHGDIASNIMNLTYIWYKYPQKHITPAQTILPIGI
jgi:hypothetical protein